MNKKHCTCPRVGTCLLFFVSPYLAAYYLQPYLVYFDLEVALATLLFALAGWLAAVGFGLRLQIAQSPSQSFSQDFAQVFPWVCKYGLYLACLVLGCYSGAILRYRAEAQLSGDALGMPASQVQLFYGSVMRDAVPARNQGQQANIRFVVQLFAVSDAKQLMTSAQGRVYVRARLPNPLPALGQRLAIRAPLRRIEDTESPVLFSSAPSLSITILPNSEPRSKQGAVQIAREPKSDFQLAGNAVQLQVPAKKLFFGLPRSSFVQLISWASSHSAWLEQNRDKLWNALRNWFHNLWEWRSAVRQRLLRSIQQVFPQQGRNLFLALLFGLAEELPEAVIENFRNSGAMHILALSGFHVGILASIAAFLLRPILGLRRSLLVNSLILALYLWLVGPLPSLTRAVFMFVLLNAYKFFLRPGNGLCILAGSAWLQTQIFPTAALSLSFQLSYSALLGLLLFAQRCNTLALLCHSRLFRRSQQRLTAYTKAILLRIWLYRALSWICRFTLQGFAITIAVLLCSSPILIANFGQLQWISLLASLVETPTITLYMWLSLALWPLAALLQYLDFQQALFHIQQFYSQLYELSVAPMEFFAPVPAWQFYHNAALRPGQLLLYLLLCATILALLWRYELLAIKWRLRNFVKAPGFPKSSIPVLNE